jgi:hypothetical protein
MRKDVAVTLFRALLRLSLEGLGNLTTNLAQDSRSLDRDLNLGLSDNEAKVLPTRLFCSVRRRCINTSLIKQVKRNAPEPRKCVLKCIEKNE